MTVARGTVKMKTTPGPLPRRVKAVPAVKAVHTADMTSTMRLRRMPGRARRGMGRVWGPLTLLLVTLAIDWAAFGSFGLFGVRPQLLLVLVCVTALHGGVWIGAVVGAVLGLFADLGGGHLIGLSVFGYGAAAFVAGLFSTRLFADRILIIMSAVGLGTLTEQFVYVAGTYAFGYPLDPWSLAPRLLPLLIVYHWLLTPIMYPFGRWLVNTLTADTVDAG